jgi:3-deoxy-manno-octulosonate cytidylyltransferase (CMP-KDO synthetase)
MTPQPKIVGIIPARYGSSRFPGKILVNVCGKPMIQRVYEHSRRSQMLDDLLVATDDSRIYDCVINFGGKAIMTGKNHQSGTDRIAEVLEKLDSDIVVNIQGDQPLFDPEMINEAVWPMIDNPEIKMSTLKIKIEENEYFDPSVVKVVTDTAGFALYFSRSLLPFPAEAKKIDVYEHIGLYVYQKDFLLKISKMPQTPLEKIEKLEQLRVLENGFKILVVETKSDRTAGISIDTPDDLKKVEEILNHQPSAGSKPAEG